MKSPKLELASGRTGKLSCGQEIKFVTDMEVKTVNGKTETLPKVETIVAGLTANVCPTVSADRSRISLKLDVKNTTFDRNVALFPITMFITPEFEGGFAGQPIPYTQFVQRPVIEVVRADTTVDLASQSSAMQYLGKQVVPYDRESTRTMFAEIPYVNRLFKTTTTVRESQHVILIATATFTEITLARALVDDYRTAITEGRLDDAKRFGEKALAADPACFAK